MKDAYLLAGSLRIGRDLRLALYDLSIGHFRFETHLLRGGRDDLAADIEDLARCLECVLRIAEFLDERREEEISEAVPR